MTSLLSGHAAPSGRGPIARVIIGLFAMAFGLATIAEGGHALFGGAAARAAHGNVVPFVLGFNFGAGFVYVTGGILTLANRPAAIRVAQLLALATGLVFAALGVHVAGGGAFEARTVMAMTLRSGFWLALALGLPRFIHGGRNA